MTGRRPGRRLGRRLRARWRRSLQLRVVATTVLLSGVVVLLIGAVLIQQLVAGLLGAKEDAARGEVQAGLGTAQLQVDSFDRGDPGSARELLGGVISTLGNRAGAGGRYDVVLLSSAERQAAGAPGFVSNEIAVTSIPGDLRDVIAVRQVPAYRYVDIRYVDGRPSVPGLAYGGPLDVPGGGLYELYYLYPLTQEQETLDLVQRTLAFAGLGLLLLIGLIGLLVARQVVAPVRMAARTAERLSAGRLRERMQVRGEDDLARLAMSFNTMAASLQAQIRQLEELSRLQRRFVADVSHELRTPLTTVRMAADVLHEERQTFHPAVRRSAELLQHELDRFEALLAELLEISRFDAGAAALDAEPVDLRDVARRVVEAAQPLADRFGVERGGRLRLQVPTMPCVADMDRRRIERVLRNLVVNAIEHGGGREVVVRVAAGADAVAASVRDHGVGLNPGEEQRVFDRFWRADPARARGIGGTGLGLSIAVEDTRLHGGRLEAWGQPGGGAHFRLTLPHRVGEPVNASPIPLVPDDALAPPAGAPAVVSEPPVPVTAGRRRG
ncbi:MAG: HAMP domain-containing histidine kinase [Acidothermales bacterium]|nr:HAMP domain-containing histidine kinase [Acidothermales bacterium]